MADSRASIRFDTFLFTSAATVLITRTYLELTGYPQIGGHSQLHIAHVLWGGLLLFVAMTIMMVSVGSTAKFWASLIGGIGFGLFIDEIGKFLTKDVNYFFKPAIAIIYGVLITAYVIGREVLRRVKLTGPRTRALVAIGIADNELGQLTEARRDTLRALLAQIFRRRRIGRAAAAPARVDPTPNPAHQRGMGRLDHSLDPRDVHQPRSPALDPARGRHRARPRGRLGPGRHRVRDRRGLADQHRHEPDQSV